MMRRGDGVRAHPIAASVLQPLALPTFLSCSERYFSAHRWSCCSTAAPETPAHSAHQCLQSVRRMVAFQLVCTVWLWSQPAVSFTQPNMRTRSAATSLRSGATQQSGELKDYAGAAGGLFGTYRIPASLFAGASAGAAFAMPILAGEAATLGYVKRIYAALMISSLVCQLQVIVVSTVALERLSRPYDKEVSVESFMRRYFDLEWIAVRLNFFVGVLSFVTAIGLRAWQASACVGIKFRAPHAIDARCCLRSCVCAMAWRFHAIDATVSPSPRRLGGGEAREIT